MNSLRYIKKVAGDQDELTTNAAKLGLHDANDTEELASAAAPPHINPFDLLLTSDDDDEATAADASSAVASKKVSTKTKAIGTKSKKRRNQHKANTANVRNEEGSTSAEKRDNKPTRLEDMTEEQLLKYYADQRNASSNSDSQTEFAGNDMQVPLRSVAERFAHFPLIRVEAQYLSGEEELREIMPMLDLDSASGGDSTRARRSGAGSRKARPSFKFIRPESSTSYPPLAGVGLSMTLERVDGKTDEKTFAYKRNEKYRTYQAEFLERQVNMDIEGLFHLYMQAPYNIDNLITIAEFHRMQEEPETGRKKLQAALYALESVAHHKFSYTDGLCRLEYHIPANRSFMLVVFDYMLHMSRKNCYKTALECCKLLLSLNYDDPLALLVLIDYYALMSDSYDTLIEFYSCYEQERRLDMMPNFRYSLALASFMKANQLAERIAHREQQATKKTSKNSNNEAAIAFSPDEEATICDLRQKARTQLEQAVIKFPHVALSILKTSDFPVIPFIRDHEYFKNDGKAERPALFYLNTLTAVRTCKLWTDDPVVVSWLVDTVEKTLAKYDTMKSEIATRPAEFSSFVAPRLQAEQMYTGLQVPVNLYRHVFLCGLATNSDLQLPAFTRVLSLGVARFDPIPPEDTINRDECDLMAVIRRQAQRRLDDRRRQAANEPTAPGGGGRAAGGIMGEFNLALDYLRSMLPGTGNDDLDEHEMHALLDGLQQQQQQGARAHNVAADRRPAARGDPVARLADSTSEGLYNAGRALRDALGNLFEHVGVGAAGGAAHAAAAAADDAAAANPVNQAAARRRVVAPDEQNRPANGTGDINGNPDRDVD